MHLLVSVVQAMAPPLPSKMHTILGYNFMVFGDPSKLTHVSPKFKSITIKHYKIIKILYSQKHSFSARLPETSSRRYPPSHLRNESQWEASDSLPRNSSQSTFLKYLNR